MRILSINVGQPREVQLQHGTVLTSIFKTSVAGRRTIRQHNIEGDRQSDLSVHGGPYKAVYAYASEHYDYWLDELPEADLTPGAFGENLTLAGLTEEDAFIGDQYRAGSAVLQVTQPRMPCFKLNIRFDRSDMVRRFWRSNHSGMYFSVVEEGEVEPGDEIQVLHRDPTPVSILDVVRLFKGETHDENLLQRTLQSPLHGSWKKEIQERRQEEAAS
jgi:MOSC domain-containing protein YiiM